MDRKGKTACEETLDPQSLESKKYQIGGTVKKIIKHQRD